MSERMMRLQNHGSKIAKFAKMKSRHTSCEVTLDCDEMLAADEMLLRALPVVRAKHACQRKVTITRSVREGHIGFKCDDLNFRRRYSTLHVHKNEMTRSGIIT